MPKKIFEKVYIFRYKFLFKYVHNYVIISHFHVIINHCFKKHSLIITLTLYSFLFFKHLQLNFLPNTKTRLKSMDGFNNFKTILYIYKISNKSTLY